MPRNTTKLKSYGLPLLAFGALSGCDIFEQILEGLADLADEPRFAYVTEHDADPDPAFEDIATFVRTATIVGDDQDQGFNFNEVRILENASLVDSLSITWSPEAEQIAFEFYEFIPGGEFDIWVYVFDRALSGSFAASDDNLAGDASRDCATDENIPETVAGFLAEEIALGASPAGTTAEVLWGTGFVLSADFVGWVSEDAFYVTVEHDPQVNFISPDGTSQPIPWGTGGLLGDMVQLGLLYERVGTGWEVQSCGFSAPAIIPIGTPLRDVAIDSGALTLDGAPLLDINGQPLGGTRTVTRVAGPY
ncbi:MAG: hypothetical protein AAGD04_16880 [Pseudomonadota bacterium]